MSTRREFIKKAGGGMLVMGMPMHIFASDAPLTKLTILHTNDMHSRIDPFPMDGSKMQGKGGMAKRATLIEKIRREEQNILLLDSGDIFQGTPYFNFFGGELEFKLMSKMGYDVATMGNHDFDAGIEGFVKQLPHAQFEFVVSNYDVSNSALAGHIKPFTIRRFNNVVVGIFGLGIELEGLVPQRFCDGVVYEDPIRKAQETTNILKKDYKCDFVICLSHLGYRYDEAKVSDVILAKETYGIDLILGGHTHTFLNKPEEKSNKLGKPVLINQVGFGGAVLGRIDILFEQNFVSKCDNCRNIIL